jgi:hypothetical protein
LRVRHFRVISGNSLRSGNSYSCGCWKSDQNRTRGTHRMAKTRTYKSWSEMKARCYNRSSIRYPRYGGRGIKVCDRWRNSFENFLSDMGVRPAKKTLDRINTNGDYEPSNCRWATYKEQANNKAATRHLTFNGQTKCIRDWAAELEMWPATIQRRLDKGWRVERALMTPPKKKMPKGYLDAPRPSELSPVLA